jgi:uncharacterized protein YraI
MKKLSIFLSLFLILSSVVIYAAKVPTRGRVSPKIGVNVRTGPGTTYSKITAIPCGHDLEIIEVSGYWYKIVYGSVTGYSIASAITVTESREEDSEDDDSVRKFLPTLLSVDPSTR